jgi:hypothetical protein
LKDDALALDFGPIVLDANAAADDEDGDEDSLTLSYGHGWEIFVIHFS